MATAAGHYGYCVSCGWRKRFSKPGNAVSSTRGHCCATARAVHGATVATCPDCDWTGRYASDNNSKARRRHARATGHRYVPRRLGPAPSGRPAPVPHRQLLDALAIDHTLDAGFRPERTVPEWVQHWHDHPPMFAAIYAVVFAGWRLYDVQHVMYRPYAQLDEGAA